MTSLRDIKAALSAREDAVALARGATVAPDRDPERHDADAKLLVKAEATVRELRRGVSSFAGKTVSARSTASFMGHLANVDCWVATINA